MKSRTKRLPLICGICFAVIVCPVILYSVVKAQEQSACNVVEPSEQVSDLNGLCSPSNQKQDLEPMVSAEEFFRRGRDFDRQGKSQEAIAEYTRAIELDPNYAEAYFFRGNALALEGQPQKGIEDAQKAVAIYQSRGNLERAEAMMLHEKMIREGMQEGEF
ncbi:tetratricopeptide repeat protein [Nostocales cyanobacterium LEGE 11386]|nr:tetratricopeptide repeat protein [Nostocales cyanobacterium LEGE 11386]